MQTVLILTAGFGDGHNSAARNLQQAFSEVSPETQTLILDPLQQAWPRPNNFAKTAYHQMINHAPTLWGGVYHLLNLTATWPTSSTLLRKVRDCLSQYIQCYSPCAILATYPLYAHFIKSLYPNPATRPFKFGVVVTDSITINRTWTAAGADFFCVADQETAQMLDQQGIPPKTVFATGFPVSSQFAQPKCPTSDWDRNQNLRVLYILNHGSRKALKTAKKILKLPSIHLTVVTGRSAALYEKLKPLTKGPNANNLNLLGWTDHLPELMTRSHLVITKAGGATLQEAIAAGKPVIVNQVVPGQEVGNAQLITQNKMGVVAETPKEVAAWCDESLRKRGRLYRQWRLNTEKYHRPNASLRIAELTLQKAAQKKSAPGKLQPQKAAAKPETLLADFYVCNPQSGGTLALPAITNLYGQLGFGIACVVHHSPEAPSASTQSEFLLELSKEQTRAWDLFQLILLPGFEFPTQKLTPSSPLNFLAVGLQTPTEFVNCLEPNISSVQRQGGLAIALLPRTPKRPAKNTFPANFSSRWNAWGFTGPSLPGSWLDHANLPCIAGSRLRSLPDIRSWKSTLHCKRNPTAVLDSIRQNRNLGLTCFPN